MRDFGKVHTSFWSSQTIGALSEDARTLAFYLLTCPHSTIAGVFRLPDGYACEDLRWPPERVREGFTELFRNGFANRCETTKWVRILKHFEWNAPENPNQWKAALKIAGQVPSECEWIAEYYGVFNQLSGHSLPLISNPCESLSEPFRNQDKDQDQDKTTLVDSKPSTPGCPHQEIIELYHELLPTGTRVRIWDGTRAKHLQARWREDSKRQSLDWWRKFFIYCAESLFLTSKVPPSHDRKPFVIALDWIVNPTNFAKIVEGRYHGESAA